MEQRNSLKLSQKVIVILADILVLAEICYAMSVAAKSPTELTPVFMKAFLPLALPTIVAAIVLIRVLRDRKQPSQAQS